MMDALDTTLTAAAGGITGIIGHVIGRGFNIFDNIQQAKFKKLDQEHELALIDRQMELKVWETESAERIAEYAEYSNIREASYTHDSGLGQASQWVINALRLVRPALTIYLILLVTAIWFSTEFLDNNVRITIIDTILYLSTTVIVWWFGDRSPNLIKRRF